MADCGPPGEILPGTRTILLLVHQCSLCLASLDRLNSHCGHPTSLTIHEELDTHASSGIVLARPGRVLSLHTCCRVASIVKSTRERNIMPKAISVSCCGSAFRAWVPKAQLNVSLGCKLTPGWAAFSVAVTIPPSQSVNNRSTIVHPSSRMIQSRQSSLPSEPPPLSDQRSACSSPRTASGVPCSVSLQLNDTSGARSSNMTSNVKDRRLLHRQRGSLHKHRGIPGQDAKGGNKETHRRSSACASNTVDSSPIICVLMWPPGRAVAAAFMPFS